MDSTLFPPPSIEWPLLLPLLIVVGTGVAVLLWDLFVPHRNHVMHAWLSVAGLGAAAYFAVLSWAHPDATTFAGALTHDRLSVISGLLLMGATALSVMFAEAYLRERKANYGEFYPLALWATAGAMLMVSTTDLIVLFLGLETLSVSLYVLSGMCRADRRSEEAAIKYFLLGAFASGFLLFGMAMIYGGTGTSRLEDIASAWMMGDRSIQLFLTSGITLMLVGLGFKAALVPFHWWTPDVYQGAPTAVTAYMAAVAKTAAFVALIRVLGAAMTLQDVWSPILTTLALLTMTFGNLWALAQNDVKRMLAYSSIAHAGYVLVGVLAGDVSAVVYYLVAYSLMTVGSFAVVGLTARGGKEGSSYGDLRGLWKRAPFAALMLLVLLISLAGIPPTAGFWGKWFLFLAALRTDMVGLAVVLAINSVVSVYYYLRLVLSMYVEEELVESGRPPAMSAGLVIATLACAAGVIYVGLTAGSLQRLFTIPMVGGS
ncbi:MAG: NADH-quinone oxidoreductase subunit N [Fimbriimonadales bacterium]